METRNRAWLLAAVGGMMAGLCACGGNAPEGEVPTTAPADPAPPSDGKNHCSAGEPHHCASEGGKHVCSAAHEHGAEPSDAGAAGDGATADASPTASPVDAGVPSGVKADAGAKAPGHTHTHSDGKPHKH